MRSPGRWTVNLVDDDGHCEDIWEVFYAIRCALMGDFMWHDRLSDWLAFITILWGEMPREIIPLATPIHGISELLEISQPDSSDLMIRNGQFKYRSILSNM
jgi:hypothetical protein